MKCVKRTAVRKLKFDEQSIDTSMNFDIRFFKPIKTPDKKPKSSDLSIYKKSYCIDSVTQNLKVFDTSK